MTRKPSMPAPTRRDDAQPMRVTRDIPLWSVVLALAGIAGQAVLMWAEAREQATSIRQLTQQGAVANEHTGKIVADINAKGLKDLEHDMLLRDIERRLLAVEQPAPMTRRGPKTP